jgi:hypothetical protein
MASDGTCCAVQKFRLVPRQRRPRALIESRSHLLGFCCWSGATASLRQSLQSVAEQHVRTAISADERNPWHAQASLEKAPRRFMAEIVEPEIGQTCSLDDTLPLRSISGGGDNDLAAHCGGAQSASPLRRTLSAGVEDAAEMGRALTAQTLSQLRHNKPRCRGVPNVRGELQGASKPLAGSSCRAYNSVSSD